MSCLSRRDRNTDRLKVTHLTHQNHIRILTKRRPQGIGITLGVQPDLSLIDHSHLVLMQILDRILQRDDMGVSVIVYLIYDGCQRGGLTASGRTRHKDQPSLTLIQINDRFRHTQNLRGRNLCTHKTQRQCGGASLFVRIDTISSQFRNGEGHVILSVFLKLFPLHVTHDRISDSQCILRRQLRIIHCDQISIDPHLRRNSYSDMYVRCAGITCSMHNFLNRWHFLPLYFMYS